MTPDLQPEGDLSLSAQWQSSHIANPYEAQTELGLTKFAKVAVFKGFKPNELIFGTEIGLLTEEPYLLSIGFINGRRIAMSILSHFWKLAIILSTTK